mgnify:CR=1 FL=1
MKKTLNVAMIGGGFMGKAHSNALARIPMFFDADLAIRRRALCGLSGAEVRRR